MNKKLAKIKYLPNNFQIIEEGDHVICAISGKQISIENLNYWNLCNFKKNVLYVFHFLKSLKFVYS